MDSGGSEKDRRGRYSPAKNSRNGEWDKRNDRRRRYDSRSRSRDRGLDRSRTRERVWEVRPRGRRRDDSRARQRRSRTHSRSRGRGNSRSDILPPPTIRKSKFSSPPANRKPSPPQTASPPPPPDKPPPPPPTTLPPPKTLPPPTPTMQRPPGSQMPYLGSNAQFCKASPSLMPAFLKNSAPQGFGLPHHARQEPGFHGHNSPVPLGMPPNIPFQQPLSMHSEMNAPTQVYPTFPPFPADSYPSAPSRRGVRQSNMAHAIQQPPLGTGADNEQRRVMDTEQRRVMGDEQRRAVDNEQRYSAGKNLHHSANEVARRHSVSQDSRDAKRRKPEAEPREDKMLAVQDRMLAVQEVDSPSQSLDRMMEMMDEEESSSAERKSAPRIPSFSAPDWNHPTGGIRARTDYDPLGLCGPPSKYKYKKLARPPKRDDPLEVLFSAHAVPSTEYLEKLASKLCSRGTKPRVIVPTGPPICIDMMHAGRCKAKRCPYEHDAHQVAQWKYYFSRTPCSGGYECHRKDRGCHYRHVTPGKAK
eukprot:GEMP01007841.1.p1 GENE.GEMP01007841.1~~GEMP01007841.1.p1  ORF type:complete len:529 (+),score=100.41 GEMP01007841.1:19-1605(+)